MKGTLTVALCGGFDVERTMASSELRTTFASCALMDCSYEVDGFSLGDLQRVYVAAGSKNERALYAMVFCRDTAWMVAFYADTKFMAASPVELSGFSAAMGELMMDSLITNGTFSRYERIDDDELLEVTETIVGTLTGS